MLCVLMTSFIRDIAVQIFQHHWSIILNGPMHGYVRVKNRASCQCLVTPFRLYRHVLIQLVKRD
jgi:hypothetical protein